MPLIDKPTKDTVSKRKITCLTRKTSLKLSPERWLEVLQTAAQNPAHVIKQDGLKRTVLTALAPWGKVCLHDFDYSSGKRILSAFRPRKGKKNWRHWVSLLKFEIPIVEPVLYLEIKKGLFTFRTYTATLWIEGENLARTARSPEKTGRDRLMELLRRACVLAAGIHKAGYVHGDLKWSNFLWVDDSPARVILSDLDHIRRSDTARDQAKDLARFILGALEFNLGWDAANDLIGWYFDNRKVRPAGMEDLLYKFIHRKKEKYERRNRG